MRAREPDSKSSSSALSAGDKVLRSFQPLTMSSLINLAHAISCRAACAAVLRGGRWCRGRGQGQGRWLRQRSVIALPPDLAIGLARVGSTSKEPERAMLSPPLAVHAEPTGASQPPERAPQHSRGGLLRLRRWAGKAEWVLGASEWGPKSNRPVDGASPKASRLIPGPYSRKTQYRRLEGHRRC